MSLDLNKVYYRNNNILYQDGIPIVKFTKSKFTDWPTQLGEKGVKYMQKYMNMFPTYWEHYKKEQIETGQIILLL